MQCEQTSYAISSNSVQTSPPEDFPLPHSLVIETDPQFSYCLILYLKWYCDKLYQWKETARAI
jgi:hypothetical protein